MGVLGNDAKRILAQECNRFGVSATITRQTASAYSVSTSQSTLTATSLTVKGSFKNPNRGSQDGRGDGMALGATDVSLNARIFVIPMLDTSLAEFSYVPAIGDKITIHGVGYSIRWVDPYFTDDVQTQMDLHLEQA